jgi:hypothetical protein
LTQCGDRPARYDGVWSSVLRIKPRRFFKSEDAVSRPHINGIDQNDDQSERAKYAKHDLVAVGPVHCWSPTGISGRLAARSRFKRAVLVLRMLRRPVIDAKLRPNAAPTNTWGFPVAASSRSRLSSSGVQRLLLFLGIARADVRMRLPSLIVRRARGFLCPSQGWRETPVPVFYPFQRQQISSSLTLERMEPRPVRI